MRKFISGIKIRKDEERKAFLADKERQRQREKIHQTKI